MGAERTSFPTAPVGYTVGGTTGQAETIRDGPGPGRCRGYFNKLNTLPTSSGYVIRVGYEPIRTNCHAG